MTLTEPRTTSAAAAVIATVSYSDVFDMPIGLEDVHQYLVGYDLDGHSIVEVVDDLVERGELSRTGDLLSLPGRDAVIDTYRDRVARAEPMWIEAKKWGRRIGRLPFVRMVAVTGGLAVDSVADHDDIDYFIVVRPGRLWLTRAMILLLGRLAARRDLELCPNFIVSETAIEMQPHTLYVARELAQMKVIVGDRLCQHVRSTNRWMFDFLPNATIQGSQDHAISITTTRLQRLAEAVLLTAPFEHLEKWEMHRKVTMLTQVRSRRLEVGAPDESSFSRDVCKGHMVGNAAGIDIAWKERLRHG